MKVTLKDGVVIDVENNQPVEHQLYFLDAMHQLQKEEYCNVCSCPTSQVVEGKVYEIQPPLDAIFYTDPVTF